MKYRVERERTDHGYGPGWVVLNRRGFVIFVASHWVVAFALAERYASHWVRDL